MNFVRTPRDGCDGRLCEVAVPSPDHATALRAAGVVSASP